MLEIPIDHLKDHKMDLIILIILLLTKYMNLIHKTP
jgi:hypothetical protein